MLLLMFQFPTHSQLDEVTSLIQDRQYTEAVNKLELLAESSNNVETRSKYFYQLGEIYYNYTQQYPNALNAYKKILEMKASGLPVGEIYLAYIKIGDVYSRMGEYEKAIQNFLTLVDTAPETHFVYEIGMRKIREIRNALSDLMLQQQIIKTYKGTPLEAIAQFQIGELYRNHTQLNQPEKAIESYQVLLKRHPTDMIAAEAQWRIAHLRHTVLHQLPLAIESYKKVADNYPTSNFAAEALFHIATLHRETENYNNALNVYNAIVENYPNFWNMHAVHYWSGNCYEKTENYNEALNSYKTFLYVYLPKLDPVYFGQISMYNKSVEEVTELIQTKINTFTKQIPIIEFEKLENEVDNDDYENALVTANNLIVNFPGTQYAKRAATQLNSIKHRAAIQKLITQIQENKTNAADSVRAQLHIATIYERELLDYSKAVDAFYKVVQDYPKSPYAAEAYYRIGMIYADILEKPNSALKTFNIVVVDHPNSLQAMMATFQVGEIYRKLERFDEALEAYQTTVSYPERELYLSEGYHDSYADRAQFRIGRVNYEDQRYTDSRYAFENFIKNRSGSPRLAAAHIYLAVMHQDSGENKMAVDHYLSAEKLLMKSQIQMQMVIDEAGSLGYQSPEKVIAKLQEVKND